MSTLVLFISVLSTTSQCTLAAEEAVLASEEATAARSASTTTTTSNNLDADDEMNESASSAQAVSDRKEDVTIPSEEQTEDIQVGATTEEAKDAAAIPESLSSSPTPTTEQELQQNEGREEEEKNEQPVETTVPVQNGPFIDLLGETLLSLEMMDERHAQLHSHYTNEALQGKKVIGLYFSADW